MKKVLFVVYAFDWNAEKEQYYTTRLIETESPDSAFRCFKNMDVSSDRPQLELEVDNGYEIITIAFKCAVCDENEPYILMDGNNDDTDYDGIAKALIAIPTR